MLACGSSASLHQKRVPLLTTQESPQDHMNPGVLPNSQRGEVAKERSCRTVKHQEGIAGLDMAAILAKRGQSEQVRAMARADAVAKAKEVKKAKEAKKEKTKVRFTLSCQHGQLTAVIFSSCLFSTYTELFQTAPRTSTTAPKISKQQAKGAGGPRGGRY